jgi:hypothetical protein
MRFIHFMFGFLFTRNWYTGQLELSRSRMALFSAMVFLVILGLFLITLLQAPVTYEAGKHVI